MEENTNPLKQLLQALETRSVMNAEGSAISKTKSLVPSSDAQVPEHNVPKEAGYLPEVYNAQRDIGTRRENGALKLKKLKPIHKQIIAYHLAAWPNEQICAVLNKSASWVSTVLNDPLSQEVINTFEDLHEEEFKRMRILANSALRDAMQPTKPDSSRLRAARIFYQKDGEQKAEKGETAEDVMAKILTKIEAENVQVNFHLGQRVK